MKICVVHLCDVCDCFVSSSLNLGLAKKYPKADITWVVDGDEQKSLFTFSKVNVVKLRDVLNESSQKYDLLINLCPHLHPSDPIVNADKLVFQHIDA